jgi:AhpD family alkylhydroperoxidase
MARVPYADDSAHPELAGRIRDQRGGTLLNLYRMLLNSPPVAEGWLSLLTAVRQQCALPALYRELVILRVAVLNDAPYEFGVHVPFARREGMTDEQIEALRVLPAGAQAESTAAFDPVMGAVLRYVDSMTREIHVPDDIFQSVSAHFPTREMVELTVTVAAYNMVSRFLEALHMDPEPA